MEAQAEIGKENNSPLSMENETDLELDVSKDRRKSYSRETKLAAYHESQNRYKTAKNFGL